MKSRGFTLLETLVAVAILGLILAFYGGSLRLMLGAVARQSTSVDAADARTSTSQAVRRILEAMQPITQLPNQPPSLEAGPHVLRFVTTLPGQLDPVDATLERDGAGRLILLWSPRRHVRALGPPPLPTTTELATGLASVDFSYWHNGTWTASLPAGELPSLVRVRLTPRTGRAGADLIAALNDDTPL